MVLNFKKFGFGHPLVILHGLMGSLDNWQGIAKKLAEKYEVYIVDQRNHGHSPHSDEFNYELLSSDLLELFDSQIISTAHLIGHSMGGKTAMRFALDHPERVDKLIVVDISPASYGDHHSMIFNALYAAKVEQASDRKGVEEVLREKLGADNENTIQFLMKGLVRDDAGKNFKWRFNIDSLSGNYKYVNVPIESKKPFEGETLFIKGEKSNYINPNNYGSIMDLFPNNHISKIKMAGHWVHADKPAEFVKEVEAFLG